MAGTGDNVHLSYSFPGFLLVGRLPQAFCWWGGYNSNVTRKFLQLHYFS